MPYTEAHIDTERPCPFCGKEILLADCPIVATTELYSEFQRRFASHPRWPGQTLASPYSDRPLPIIAAPPDLEGIRERYSQLQESYRNASRVKKLFNSRPLGVPELPTPLELAAELGGLAGRPRRACPSCGAPFPDGFEDRESFVFSVVGAVGSAKSTFLGQLYELTWRNGGSEEEREKALAVAGLIHLRPIPGEAEVIKSLGASVRDGEYPGRTDAAGEGRSYRPSVFNVATTRREGLLFLFDVSGEDVTDPSNFAFYCPFVAWSDGVIVMIDPGSLDRRFRDQTAGNSSPYEDMGDVDEGEMISGLLEQLANAENYECPITIVLTCADVFASDAASFGDLKSLVGQNSEETKYVKELLGQIGGGHVIQAVSRWAGPVSYKLMAALPHAGAPSRDPIGVLEALASVVVNSTLAEDG